MIPVRFGSAAGFARPGDSNGDRFATAVLRSVGARRRVGGAADAEERDEPAGGAGADRGGGPVEAVVDALHDGRRLGFDDNRLAAVGDRRVGFGPCAGGGGGERRVRRSVAAKRVMRCGTFMTASFRGGPEWTPGTVVE